MILDLISQNGLAWSVHFVGFLLTTIGFLLTLILQHFRAKIKYHELSIEKVKSELLALHGLMSERFHQVEMDQKAQEVELKEVLRHLDRIEIRLKEIHAELTDVLKKCFGLLPN